MSTTISDSISRFSFILMAALIGNNYVFLFVSNQIAVFHSLAPIFAVALSLPQPSSDDLKSVLISSDVFSGSDRKCQPPVAECCQRIALNSYFTLPIIFARCPFILD